MRLDKAAHLATILALPPAYITLWLLFRPYVQQQQSGAAIMPSNPWLLASIGAFFALFTLGAIPGIVALARKKKGSNTEAHLVIPEARDEPLKQDTLPDRVGQLARELFQFLQQRPAPIVEDGPNLRETFRKAMLVNWERLPNINDGYMARFHDKVEKMIYELGVKASGIGN